MTPSQHSPGIQLCFGAPGQPRRLRPLTPHIRKTRWKREEEKHSYGVTTDGWDKLFTLQPVASGASYGMGKCCLGLTGRTTQPHSGRVARRRLCSSRLESVALPDVLTPGRAQPTGSARDAHTVRNPHATPALPSPPCCGAAGSTGESEPRRKPRLGAAAPRAVAQFGRFSRPSLHVSTHAGVPVQREPLAAGSAMPVGGAASTAAAFHQQQAPSWTSGDTKAAHSIATVPSGNFILCCGFFFFAIFFQKG